MKFQFKTIFLGTLVGSFCACSFLGDRQESTRLDLESSPISKIRILSKDDKKKTTTDAKDDLASLSAGEVGYESKFTHPNLDAKKYIIENKIDLESIATGEAKDGKSDNVFSKMDRASMFFDLGGRIAGKLGVIEPTTENLEKISASIGRPVEALPYSEPKSNEMKAKLIEQNPACDGNIHPILTFGNAAIDLTRADLAYLNLTTTEREEIQNKTLSPNKVTPYPFSSLDIKDQNDVYVSFDPKLNAFTISIAQYFEACLPPDGKATAIVASGKSYIEVPSDQIKVDGDKVTITVVREVPKDELSEYKISNGKTLGEIAFITKKKLQETGDESKGRTPVFTMPTYKNTYTFSFLKDTKAGEVKKEDKVDEKKDEKKDEQPTDKDKKETSPTEKTNPTTTTVTPDQTQPALTTPNIETQTKNNEVTLKTKSVVIGTQTQTKNDSIPLNPNMTVLKNDTNVTKTPYKTIPNKNDSDRYVVKNDTNVTKTPIKVNTLDAVIKDLTKAFPSSPDWYKENWFSPLLTHYAENNYSSDGDGGFIYSTNNDRLSNYWDNSRFSAEGLSEDTVKAKCQGYDFVRNLHFSANFEQPPESKWGSYYTISDGKNTKNKKYKDVLYDQFWSTALEHKMGTGSAIEALVAGMINTPPGINVQNFDLKICFKQFTGDFVAFWSSDDTRATSYTVGGKPDYKLNDDNESTTASVSSNVVAFTGSNTKPWFQSQATEAKKADKPWIFPSRKPNAPHSDLHVACKDGNCYGVFHLTFRRDLAPPKLFAYINKNDLYGFLGKYRQGIIDNVIKSRKEKGDLNRNEMVVFGGFEFKGIEKEAPANYLTPHTLKSKGLVNYNETKINYPILATFPGESADFYLPISTTDQISTQTFAKR